MAKLRLAFMGTPDFSVPALNALIAAGHEIAAVYSQPPRPAGRGKKLTPSPVHRAAESAGIEVRTPVSLKSDAEAEAFAALHLDAAVVVAYGLILPKAILDAPRLGCLNIHASLLPRWRGAAPIQRAILAGDTETGICAMRMEEGLDTGPVLSRHAVVIGPRETGGALHDRLSNLGASAIVETLEAFNRGAVSPTPQDSNGITYAAKLEKPEGRIDWSKPAREIDRQVRALTPWPGCFFFLPEELGGDRVKLLSAMPTSRPGENAPVGTVLDPATALVSCGTGSLVLEHVQRAGKTPVPGAVFISGLNPKGEPVKIE